MQSQNVYNVYKSRSGGKALADSIRQFESYGRIQPFSLQAGKEASRNLLSVNGGIGLDACQRTPRNWRMTGIW